MKNFLLLSVLLLLCLSCETELTNLSIKNPTTALVVFGELSANAATYRVRIQQPTGYSAYDTREFSGKGITKAVVQLVAGGKVVAKFAEQGEGVYQLKQADFLPVQRTAYQLRINTSDGLVVESEEEVLLAPPVLAATATNLHEAEQLEEMYVDVNATISDAASTTDFYLIRRQDYEQFLTTCPSPPPPPASSPPCYQKCWQAPLNTQIQYFDDRLTNGREIRRLLHRIPFRDITPYVVDVEVMRVSKSYFDFWRRLEEQRTLTGSIFDKVPAQIRGNLRCINQPEQEILGYFAVVGLHKERIEVDRFKALSPEKYEKLVAEVIQKGIRYPQYPLWNCWQAGWIPYNIGQTLPPR